MLGRVFKRGVGGFCDFQPDGGWLLTGKTQIYDGDREKVCESLCHQYCGAAQYDRRYPEEFEARGHARNGAVTAGALAYHSHLSRGLHAGCKGSEASQAEKRCLCGARLSLEHSVYRLAHGTGTVRRCQLALCDALLHVFDRLHPDGCFDVGGAFRRCGGTEGEETEFGGLAVHKAADTRHHCGLCAVTRRHPPAAHCDEFHELCECNSNAARAVLLRLCDL